ncbi:MAG TPA: helix-turn-helix transcriptional regulator [Thermoanaerobaculia bacterium]|nr:helix-turn-helix transcriptional regulator [Thermoanaerobaculia bacterium]
MGELQERLGDRIARLRRALGWNQSDLAARVGCKLAQISKYERNAYEPRLATLSRMAAVFGTSTDYLITGREAPHLEPDRLIAIWPALERLPRDLRNEIADFLNAVLRAESLLGLAELACQRRLR